MIRQAPIRYNYPAASYEDDPHGEDALWEGGRYYDKGMSITDPSLHEERIKAFQAAEQLYLQAAERGNALASMCLGYVYSYDRCEGRYWADPMTPETAEGRAQPLSREKRAFECFSVAAEAGIPEACYKLGDMYKHGTGCDPDAAKAYGWYLQASKLASNDEEPAILGSIALRLADCLEEGFGCEQSFTCALQMYRNAIAALEVAVEGGEAWYEKALAGARAGAKRCQQEVAS